MRRTWINSYWFLSLATILLPTLSLTGIKVFDAAVIPLGFYLFCLVGGLIQIRRQVIGQ